MMVANAFVQVWDGVELLSGFKPGVTDYDTLELPSTGFQNPAAVLRDGTYGNGDITITDLRTSESVQLQGVNEATLTPRGSRFQVAGGMPQDGCLRTSGIYPNRTGERLLSPRGYSEAV